MKSNWQHFLINLLHFSYLCYLQLPQKLVWFLQESQEKHKAWNLARILVLHGFGFSKQLKLNPDNIYISNILNLWTTKSAVKTFRFSLFFFFFCKIFVLAELLRNSFCDLRLYLRSSVIWNRLFIMCIEMFCSTLNNSMAKDCMFLNSKRLIHFK